MAKKKKKVVKKKKTVKARALKAKLTPKKKPSTTGSKSSGSANSDFLTAQYDLWIAGVKLGVEKKQYITSVSINETDEGSDSATIEIADPNMVFINDNIYTENRKVKLQMKFVGQTYTVKFDGYISNIDIDFPDNGIPELTLTCMDSTYRMNKKKYSKTYKKKTSAQIVKAICKTYGYKCVVQSGYKFKKEKTISRSYQTDIEFITSLAQNEVYPFTARLVGKTFYYVKQGKLAKKPVQTLKYNDYPYEIISFSPSINVETKEYSKGSTDKGKKKSSLTKVTNKKDTTVDSSSKDNDTKTANKGKKMKLNAHTKTWSKK